MPSHRLTPGLRFWGALIVLLALASLVDMGALHELITPRRSEEWSEHLGLMLGLVVAVLALLATLSVGMRVNAGVSPDIDRVFLVLLLGWLLNVLANAWFQLAPGSTWGHWAMHASCQFAVTSAALFMLVCAPFDAPRLRAMCWGYFLIAQVLLATGVGSGDYHEGWIQAARSLHVVFSTVLLLCMGQRLLSAGEPRAWLVLGAALTAWGVALSGMMLDTVHDVPPGSGHHVLAAYLLMLWLLVTQRVGGAPAGRRTSSEASQHSLLGGAFANTYLGWDHSDTVVDQQDADRQVMQTRRRIAQDLHDGVGSQIVSIISSLDASVPQQRAVASALEHCLLDVKILVDDIDETHESVLEALGRLRYRVQHSLDRLGIELDWQVEIEGALERVNDERSRQVLRVAQEALANVMRHSRATRVSVRCRAEVQAGSEWLLLEVQDDGTGFAVPERERWTGRGLAGMQRRAQSIRGGLTVQSKPGSGTSIRLRVPLSTS